MTLSLYDMWTKPDPESEGEFIDVNVRSEGYELLYNKSVDFDSSFTYLELPKRVTHKVYGSESSSIPKSVILEEYGEENPDRFERRPINKLTYSGIDESGFRAPGNVWGTPAFGFYNIVVEFKTTSERSSSNNLKVSPDTAMDGLSKFKSSTHPDDDEAQYYKGKSVPKRKYYVSVRETGVSVFSVKVA